MRGYIEQRLEGFTSDVTRTIMDHSGIGQIINDMHWLVLDAPPDFPLLTSDRPVWTTATLTENDAFLLMPIGPHRLFAATVSPATRQRLKARPRRQLVREVNKLVVQHAEKYAYGQTDRALRLVQKHMGERRHSSVLEMVAAAAGHEIIAPNSPLAKRRRESD